MRMFRFSMALPMDPLLHGRLIVDDHLVLRIVGRVEGEQAGQFLTLAQAAMNSLLTRSNSW
jgi:hypothetical protein